MKTWNSLTSDEKKLFNEVLFESGMKFDPALGMPVPLGMWGTRKVHDGFQSYSKVGRKLRRLTNG